MIDRSFKYRTSCQRYNSSGGCVPVVANRLGHLFVISNHLHIFGIHSVLACNGCSLSYTPHYSTSLENHRTRPSLSAKRESALISHQLYGCRLTTDARPCLLMCTNCVFIQCCHPRLQCEHSFKELKTLLVPTDDDGAALVPYASCVCTGCVTGTISLTLYVAIARRVRSSAHLGHDLLQ